MNADEPATGNVERIVATVWSELLDRSVADTTQSIFQLNATSLLATACAGRLRELLGVQVSTALFFEHPVIADFAAVIAAGPDGKRAARRAAILIRALSPADRPA